MNIRASIIAICLLLGAGLVACTEPADGPTDTATPGNQAPIATQQATRTPGSRAPVATPTVGNPRDTGAVDDGIQLVALQQSSPTPTPTPTSRARGRSLVRPTDTPEGFVPTPSPTPGSLAGFGGGGADCAFEFLPDNGFSADGSRGYRIVVVNSKRHVVVFDMADPRRAFYLPEHAFGVMYASLSSDGRYMVTLDADNLCEISTTQTYEGLLPGAKHYVWDLQAPSEPIMSFTGDIPPDFGDVFWAWHPNEPKAVAFLEGGIAQFDVRFPNIGVGLDPYPPSLPEGERFAFFNSPLTGNILSWTGYGDAIYTTDIIFGERARGNRLHFYAENTWADLGPLEVEPGQTLLAADTASDVRVFSNGTVLHYNVFTRMVTSAVYGCDGHFLNETANGTAFFTVDDEQVMGCRYGQPAPFAVMDHTGLVPAYNPESNAGRNLSEFQIQEALLSSDGNTLLTVAGPHGLLYWWDLSGSVPQLVTTLTLQDRDGRWDSINDVAWMYSDTVIYIVTNDSPAWTGPNGFKTYLYDLTRSLQPRIIEFDITARMSYYVMWTRFQPDSNRVLALYSSPTLPEGVSQGGRIVEMEIATGFQTELIELAEAPVIGPALGFDPSTVNAGFSCAGALPADQIIGQEVRVSPGTPNNVRAQPARNGELVTQLNDDEVAEVVDGPVCADGLVWWKVLFNRQDPSFQSFEGWTAQGNGREYWLEPIISSPYDMRGLDTLGPPVPFELPPPRPTPPPLP